MEDRESAVDRIIREAMEAGEFDNLPGQGRPLPGADPYDDPETWAARNLLRSSGFEPDWLADRREIAAALEAARKSLARSHAWRRAAAARQDPPALADEQWRKALARFTEAVGQINRRIQTYNLKIPPALSQLQLPVASIPRELARLEADPNAVPEEPA